MQSKQNILTMTAGPRKKGRVVFPLSRPAHHILKSYHGPAPAKGMADVLLMEHFSGGGGGGNMSP